MLARMAGVLYATAVLVAVFHEFIAPGVRSRLAFVLATGCYAAVMLLLCAILKPIHPRVAWIATAIGLAGFVVDALHWYPNGVNVDIPVHGVFCILVGWMFLRSMLVPRVFGALMVFAGLVWILYLIPSLVRSLAPYYSFAGLLGEAIPMLWLLLMGVGDRQVKKLPGILEVVS
jgi:hypothetical protein